MATKDIKVFPEKKSAAIIRREYIFAVADKIQSLVHDEKISPNDIMVLVQQRNPLGALLLNELKSRDINVAGSDRIVLPKYPAVRDLLNLLRFCINTSDDYMLCCTLKSPIYRLKEVDIFNLCTSKKRTEKSTEHDKNNTVFDVLKDIMPDIYQDLSEIIEWSKTMAPYSFFTKLLNTKNRRAKIIAALGTQVIDPLEEFLTISLAYERTQPGTLRHFIKWFITGGSEIKRDMDSSAGVRIVTIHGSKGLEAPVVFLIDTIRTPADKPEKILPLQGILLQGLEIKEKLNEYNTKKLIPWIWAPQKNASEKLAQAHSLTMNNKIAEYYRLLYVAMTRAKDRLYIYGFSPNKNPPDIAWHTKLIDIIKTMPDAKSDNETIRVSND